MSYTRSMDGHARVQKLARDCAWLDEWLAAGGGEMPKAVRRKTLDGPITHVSWKPGPDFSWEPVEQRKAA